MFATSVVSQDGSCQLNCLIEGESIVFVVTTEHDCAVSDLKEDVQRKRAMDTLKDVGPHTLELWKHQPSEKILDDRPEPDPDIPPIPLLYDGFGHFLDIMDACDNVPGLADVEVLELRKEVDDLANKMTGYFNNKDEWIDAALPCLNRIFLACRGINIPELVAKAIGSVRTGHNTADHGAGSMTTAFKNWTTGISSLPQIELVCYVARLNAMAINEEARQQLYLQWRVPCVGLTIVGCDITFYAVIAIDHCFRISPPCANTQPHLMATSILRFEASFLTVNPTAFCHAPPILTFERLPGGWFAVAMEYIESGVPITQSSLLTTHREHWMAELQGLMGSFHEKDLVHGDLWDVNIICKNDSVMLIDFDWGGKEGEVSYPTSNLNAELLQGRVSGDLRIMKEDDKRVLKNTLARLIAIHCITVADNRIIKLTVDAEPQTPGQNTDINMEVSGTPGPSQNKTADQKPKRTRKDKEIFNFVTVYYKRGEWGIQVYDTLWEGLLEFVEIYCISARLAN
ncbi:hypothetical protein PILCRDRAFT_787677 [Piloderma croceum F 1598]|uniref:non-specific serine/threonine protein kinase n=1 Tax=Piloderma croceum (strain F 1598) TaxID=765440 RepID=A0A0C3FNU8_PILCF|nr:hypothetical protein PILCRDRAFT_787677 [Piloderma croceum F 1598]